MMPPSKPEVMSDLSLSICHHIRQTIGSNTCILNGIDIYCIYFQVVSVFFRASETLVILPTVGHKGGNEGGDENSLA